jgi:hypothetical protein
MIGGGVERSYNDVTANLDDLTKNASDNDVAHKRGREFIFERTDRDGERYTPHRFRDGLYRVADPSLGQTKHHASNQIAISFDQIGSYLERGFLLRMKGDRSGQVNLIVASEIVVRKN